MYKFNIINTFDILKIYIYLQITLKAIYMEIGINDLDFYDDEFEVDPVDNNVSGSSQAQNDQDPDIQQDPSNAQRVSPPNNANQSNQNEQDDVITLMLKARNIEDPSKIKFEDEEGNIQERDWNSLTVEEQLNILNSSDTDSDYELEDSEKGLINQLRLNQMSPEEFIAYVKQQGAAEYAESLNQNSPYQVDDLTDDELFIIDLQTRVEDITEEEAKVMLERAKQDMTLFEKQMKGIREEYKQLEEQKLTTDALAEQQQNEEEFELFKDSVLDSIQSLDKIGGLDIQMDDDDMNEIANFILSTDNAGVNYLAKALDDPQTLVRMAWFALKGDEAIDGIIEYFTDKIKTISQEKYQEGLKDGKSGKSGKSKVVFTQQQTQTPTGNPSKELSIFDLD